MKVSPLIRALVIECFLNILLELRNQSNIFCNNSKLNLSQCRFYLNTSYLSLHSIFSLVHLKMNTRSPLLKILHVILILLFFIRNFKKLKINELAVRIVHWLDFDLSWCFLYEQCLKLLSLMESHGKILLMGRSSNQQDLRLENITGP